MRISWITRHFLDYRIPLFKELCRLSEGNFKLIYNRNAISDKLQKKLEKELVGCLVPLENELCFGSKNDDIKSVRTRKLTIPYQPGLLREIKKTSPDVMITDGFFKWTFGAIIYRILNKTPHVMCYEPTMHTEKHTGILRTLYRKAALNFIDIICCNGSLCAEYTENLGFPEDRIMLGNLSADNEFFEKRSSEVTDAECAALRKSFNIAAGDTLFIYVGRVVQVKGIKELLKAWKTFICQTAAPAAAFLIAGDGDELEDLKEYVESEKIRGVVFTGGVDYEELPVYYRASDCFIIPTLKDNWSLVVPEAMSCGLPVICSRYNGCWPELVQRKNGWVFDPLDSNNSVEVLIDAYNSREKLVEMGEKSKEIVQGYSPSVVAENLFKGCLRAVKRRSAKS